MTIRINISAKDAATFVTNEAGADMLDLNMNIQIPIADLVAEILKLQPAMSGQEPSQLPMECEPARPSAEAWFPQPAEDVSKVQSIIGAQSAPATAPPLAASSTAASLPKALAQMLPTAMPRMAAKATAPMTVAHLTDTKTAPGLSAPVQEAAARLVVEEEIGMSLTWTAVEPSEPTSPEASLAKAAPQAQGAATSVPTLAQQPATVQELEQLLPERAHVAWTQNVKQEQSNYWEYARLHKFSSGRSRVSASVISAIPCKKVEIAARVPVVDWFPSQPQKSMGSDNTNFSSLVLGRSSCVSSSQCQLDAGPPPAMQ